MQRPPLLSLIILVALITPLVYLLSLVRNSPSALLNSSLSYYGIPIIGSLLLVYGFITNQFENQKVLARIAFIIGGLCTGVVYGGIVWLFILDKVR